MWHRIGDVPVEESSVNIVTISEHRKECIQATEWCIDTLKERVPIWKKEYFEDGEVSDGHCCQWK
jgi:molybdopterin synthase catalytic subunit